MLTDDKLPPLPKCDIYDPNRFGVGWREASVRAYGRSVEAAATAEARALLELALEELDDGEVHAQDCMTRYGGYTCRCTKPATVAKLRAWLGEAKGDGHHGT